MNVYGILADGTFRAYYLVCSCQGVNHLLPPVGRHVSVHFEVDITSREPPRQHGISYHQVKSIGREIYRALRDAGQRSFDIERGLECKREKLLERPDPPKGEIDELDRKLETARTTRTKTAVEYLYRLGIVPQDTVDQSPGVELPALRYEIAEMMANDLAEKDDDGGDGNWEDRIYLWVEENGPFYPIAATGDSGERFKGERIPNPPGIASDIAIFHVCTPEEPAWPEGFRKPPVNYDIPHTTTTVPLAKLMANIFTDGGKVGFRPVNVRIDYRPSGVTAKAEAWAINQMNQHGENSSLGIFLRYCVRFDQTIASRHIRNLHEDFPGLKRVLDQPGAYAGGPREAIQSLSKTVTGRVLVTDCSGGARETTLAVAIARAVMAEPPGKARSDAKVDVPAPNSPTWGSYAPGWAELDKLQREMEAKMKKADGKVSWTAPSNVEVKDALLRLTEACPKKRIVQTYMVSREMENMFPTPRRDPPAIPCDDGTAEWQLVRHHRETQREADDLLSPGSNTRSWSEQAKAFAKKNSDKYADYLHAVYEVAQDPGMLLENEQEYRKYARELLRDFLKTCDATVSTPVALYKISEFARDWAPNLLVIDNIGRMTEPLTMLPMAAYPSAAAILVGDPHRAGPVTVLGKGNDHHSIWAKQRAKSLISRAHDAGCVDIVLRNTTVVAARPADTQNEADKGNED